MVAILRTSWLYWRLPTRSVGSDDLFAQAKLLHRLGFHTAAVMTARAAIDRTIRRAIESDSKSSRQLAKRCPTGQCLTRLLHLELIEREQHNAVKNAVSKMNKVCHGEQCDAARADELLTMAEAALLTLGEVTPCRA